MIYVQPPQNLPFLAPARDPREGPAEPSPESKSSTGSVRTRRRAPRAESGFKLSIYAHEAGGAQSEIKRPVNESTRGFLVAGGAGELSVSSSLLFAGNAGLV